MTPRLHDDLERGARRFDVLGGHEVRLDEVLGRARGIRRRRRATALVAAVAVAAAIAVPSVLLTRSHERTTPDPVHRLPTIERISLSALPVGDKPRTGWAAGSVWHRPDGTTLTVPGAGRLVAVAPVDRGVVAASTDANGDQVAFVVEPDGTKGSLLDGGLLMEGGLASSPSGHVVAYANPPDPATPGRLAVTFENGSGRTLAISPEPGPEASLDAVAISGDRCSTGNDCAVWINDKGAHPRVLTAVTPGMDLAPLTGIVQLADVGPDGLVAGYTRITDGGSCSRVQDPANRPLWRTCAARFLTFAPDGRHLLGSAAYADGFGDTVLKTFDARTGAPGLDLRTAAGATITQMRWEDDDHVLAVVYEGNRWGVLRIGLDRTVEYAIAPVAGDDTESPFVLPG
jgi:hypothetical protein